LDKRQKIILGIGLALILFSFLFPSWELRINDLISDTKSMYFIFDRPSYEYASDSDFYFEINYGQLVAQLFVIALITVGTIMMFDKKNIELIQNALNKKQKQIIRAGLLMIFISLLFPPWERTLNILDSNEIRHEIIYCHFVLENPWQGFKGPIEIYYNQLFVQIFIISVITTGIAFALKDRKERDR